MKKYLIALTFINLLLVSNTNSMASTKFGQDSSMTNNMNMNLPASAGKKVSIQLPQSILNAPFFNQDGAKVNLAALKGKTVVLVPIMDLCMDTCPFTTANLNKVQAKLSSDKASNVVLIAVDVDPYRDNQARIKAYQTMINANYQFWGEPGVTTKPILTKKEMAMKNPIGEGGHNATLDTFAKFFGWQINVVPQSTPPANDWMAPYKPLTYDISHSDGFWIIDQSQKVRFETQNLPTFTGTLNKELSQFMGDKSNIYTKPTYQNGWTPNQLLLALSSVDGTMY
jgi:cytochrome oxidase Cu insertion factor (SCO1/SenC/PrrC family)